MIDKRKKNAKIIILLSIIALIVSAASLGCMNPETRDILTAGIINPKFLDAEILKPSKKPEDPENTAKTSLLNNIYIGESEIQGFSPNKLNYEVMLNNKISQITVSVDKQDENETVTGIGTITLTGNEQRIDIKVTSSDKKSTSTYAITFKYKQEVQEENIYSFNYTGEVQEFIAPFTGYYQFECWGAKGGSYSGVGGNGAYTSGNLYLEKGEKLYIYVGQAGGDLQTATFNGGGSAGTSYYCRSGGGATDIRLEGGEWNDFESLKTRIMVAAGRRRLSRTKLYL